MGNFFGSGKQTSQQTQTQTQQASPEAMAAYKGLLDRLQQTGSTPYQAYQGQLVAGFTPMQQQAFQGAESAQGIYQPALTEAMAMTGRAAAPISGAQIQQYMNPYQENVIDTTMANIERQNQIQQEQLKSGAVSRGAFGGDRAGIAAAELARSQNLASQQTLAGLEAGGFQQAMAAAQAEQNRALQAGGQYAGLAGTTQALAGRDVSTLAQLGQQQQALEQARLQSAYGQYQLGQAFPYQQLSWLSPLVTGVGGAMGGTTSGTSYGTMTPAAPSMASQIAGLGMAAASLPEGVTSGISSALGSFGTGISSALSSLGPLALLASTGGAVTEKSHGGSVTEKADGGSMFGLGSMAQMPYGGTQGFVPAAAQMPQGGLRAPTLNFQQPQLIKGTTGEDIFKQASGLADAWKKRSEKIQKAEDRKQDEAQDAADDMAESWNAGTEIIPEVKRGGFVHGFANGGAPEDIDWSPIEPDRNRMAGFSTPAANAIEAFRENAQAEQARGFETEAGTKAFTERAPAEQGPAKSTRQLTFGDSSQTFSKPPSEPLQERPLGSDIPGEWATQSFADLKGRAEEGRAGFPEPMYAGARGLLPPSPLAPRGSAAEVTTPLSPEQVKAKEERRNWLGLDEETRKLLFRSGLATLAGGSPYGLQNIAGGLMSGFQTQAEEQRLAQQKALEKEKLTQQKTIEQNRLDLQRTREENLNKNRELQLNIQAGRAFPIGRYDDPLTGASRVIYGQQVWNDKLKKYEIKPIEQPGAPAGPLSLPSATQAAAEGKNETYLSDLEKSLGPSGPVYAATVRRIANYEQDPSTLPPKTRANLLSAAHAYDPNFSPSEFKEIQSARLSWTKPDRLRPIIAFSTAIDHLGYLNSLVTALENGNIPAFNRVANSYKAASGNTAQPNFDSVRGLIATEVQKASAGAMGTGREREELTQQLDKKLNADQLRTVISSYKRLMAGQLRANEKVFTAKTRYPAEKFRQQLTEEARVEIDKLPKEEPKTEGPAKTKEPSVPASLRNMKNLARDPDTGMFFQFDPKTNQPVAQWDSSGKLIQGTPVQ